MNFSEEKKFEIIRKNRLKKLGFERSYDLWSLDEDEKLLHLKFNENRTIQEIARELKRTIGSIQHRLKLHEDKQNIKDNNQIKFLKYILEGTNPITGEQLSEDSVWKHPQITNDLEFYLN